MQFDVTFSDSNIIDLDERTGNIRVPLAVLPQDAAINSEITVKFIEDKDPVKYNFILTRIDNQIALLDYVDSVESSLLTEGPLDKIKQKVVDRLTKSKEERELDKAIRRDNKQQERTAESGRKALDRDLAKGQTWNFYLNLPNGKYLKKPLQHRDVAVFYKDTDLRKNPAILNAVVADRFGSVIRRGLEDVDMQGIGIKDKDAFKLVNSYDTPWTKESIQEFTDFLASDRASDNLRKSITSQVKKADSTDIEGKSKPSVDTPKINITERLLDKLKNLVEVAGIKVLDSKLNSVDNISDITLSNISDYWVVINNKEKQLDKWLEEIVQAKLLTESTDLSNVDIEGILNEAPVVKLSPADYNNPDNFNVKSAIKAAAEAEDAAKVLSARLKKEETLKKKYSDVLEYLEKLDKYYDFDDVLTFLFEKMVPSTGKADTVAGEMIRAVMRILFRDHNDGDKFFCSYGLETCGSSAEYLYDSGFAEEVENILDDALRLADDDDAYTLEIRSLGRSVIDYIKENPNTVYTPNDTDSRYYTTVYLTSKQPRYSFEINASEEITELLDKRVITGWDLKSYVEESFEYDGLFDGAEVEDPWSTYSPVVEVRNLTYDGLEELSRITEDPDMFWEDFVDDYKEDLESEDDD